MFSQIRRYFIPTCPRLLANSYSADAATTGTCCFSTEADAFQIHEFSNKYLHHMEVKFTEKLEIVNPHQRPTFPIYRVTDSKGEFIDPKSDPGFTKNLAIRMYRCMVLVQQMDQILYNSQRQGRISFYMTNTGEEAAQVGSAAPLQDDDLIYAQYREAGSLLWRGFPMENLMHQCYGSAKDIGGGKQMPVHYGSAEHHYVTISSPLATQIPQAVGSAYAFKREKNGRVVMVYFGDGAASEGDAHGALNMASTLECPVIFFCRNNGYAISTPTTEQYGGDGIAGRAVGYGIHTIRVDGNDLFAVYNATKAARELAQQNTPVFIEAMTYRLGHHSTSDDSSVYRSGEEIKAWHDKADPIVRFKAYINGKGWWSDEDDAPFQQEIRKEVLKAFSNAEKTLKPNVLKMFDDVYKEMPKHLQQQRQELVDHLKNYGQHYPLKNFESD